MANDAEIKIIPYVEVNGMRTFSDSVIMGLFDQVESESLYQTVFYEGTVTTKKQFLDIMKGPSNQLYVLIGDKTIFGFVWLNRFEGRTAHLHFCGFKNGWGLGMNAVAAKRILSELMHLKSDHGHFYDLLIGFMPSWNKYALGFVKACGAKSAGVIPNAIYNMTSGASEPAEFIYLTREDLL